MIILPLGPAPKALDIITFPLLLCFSILFRSLYTIAAQSLARLPFSRSLYSYPFRDLLVDIECGASSSASCSARATHGLHNADLPPISLLRVVNSWRALLRASDEPKRHPGRPGAELHGGMRTHFDVLTCRHRSFCASDIVALRAGHRARTSPHEFRCPAAGAPPGMGCPGRTCAITCAILHACWGQEE